MKTINVLLASYNGSQYIKEQIQSIIMNFQHLPDYECKLYISDDNSTDSTIDIIKDLSVLDSRIQLLDGGKKGGVKENFNYLISNTSADYSFFCDQDDLWLPNKMKLFMLHFEEAEKKHDVILIHSDLCVADGNLSPIHPSMFAYQRLNKHPSIAELMVCNSVTGCVMACNKRLMEKVKASSISLSIMHDWYIALLAQSIGYVGFIDHSLILYRQHGNNVLGAKETSLKATLFKGDFKKRLINARLSVSKTRYQAEIFLKDFQNDLSAEDKLLMIKYVESFKGGFIQRFKLFMSNKVRKNGWLRNLSFFIFYVIGV